MKQSRKATLAVIVGFAGFLGIAAYDVVSGVPGGGDTGKANSTLMNDASQTQKQQVQKLLGSAHRTNMARGKL